jgi:DNA-binding NtrC family response regulator
MADCEAYRNAARRTIRRAMAAILLADDDANVRALLAQALRKAGFGVDEVGSGDEAIEKLKVGDVKLTILDLIMGGGSGTDVLAFVDTLPNPPKCVVVSALADVYAKRSSQKYLMLQKPVDVGLLVMIASRTIEP